MFQADGRLSLPCITEECLRKLDTKQQTSALLSLVWRDSASEEAFTLTARICHTLMVQQRRMVPRVRHVRPARASASPTRPHRLLQRPVLDALRCGLPWPGLRVPWTR